MELKIEVISREVVTPPSPTPPHLNQYKLSFLDQMSPPLLMPHILFYPSEGNLIDDSQRSNHLKKSLSQVLTLFYPLAGRLIGNDYVNCNDEGVAYVKARANCKLQDIISDPIPEELNKFVPCDPDGPRDLCMVVQATWFNCGGLAIGLAISHKLVDACSFFMFVNSWAATSRGDAHIQPPSFESATLFPPKDFRYHGGGGKKPEPQDIVTKRVVFTAGKIDELRNKFTKEESDEHLIRPTRFEAVSAFIWTRFMVSTGAKDDSSKIYALRIPVDIRTKVVPPLSEYNFGNLILPSITVPSLRGAEHVTWGITKKIREAIHCVDVDYIGKIQKGNEPLDIIKARPENASEGEIVMFRLSSLCRLPLYKADFGWGKPVWVGSAKIPVSNIVFFMDSLYEGGIEAWVNLKGEDMAKFESDEELLAFISYGQDSKTSLS